MYKAGLNPYKAKAHCLIDMDKQALLAKLYVVSEKKEIEKLQIVWLILSSFQFLPNLKYKSPPTKTDQAKILTLKPGNTFSCATNFKVYSPSFSTLKPFNKL